MQDDEIMVSSVPFGNSSYSELPTSQTNPAPPFLSSVPFGNSSYSESIGRKKGLQRLSIVVSAFRQ